MTSCSFDMIWYYKVSYVICYYIEAYSTLYSTTMKFDMISCIMVHGILFAYIVAHYSKTKYSTAHRNIIRDVILYCIESIVSWANLMLYKTRWPSLTKYTEAYSSYYIGLIQFDLTSCSFDMIWYNKVYYVICYYIEDCTLLHNSILWYAIVYFTMQ